MSLDFPYYEELCRQKHPAAWWWLIGDRLYYLGLLPAMSAIPAAGVAIIAGMAGFGWFWSMIDIALFVFGAFVFLVGSSLKGHAYTLAERDGISAAEVYERGASPRTPDV